LEESKPAHLVRLTCVCCASSSAAFYCYPNEDKAAALACAEKTQCWKVKSCQDLRADYSSSRGRPERSDSSRVRATALATANRRPYLEWHSNTARGWRATGAPAGECRCEVLRSPSKSCAGTPQTSTLRSRAESGPNTQDFAHVRPSCCHKTRYAAHTATLHCPSQLHFFPEMDTLCNRKLNTLELEARNSPNTFQEAASTNSS